MPGACAAHGSTGARRTRGAGRAVIIRAGSLGGATPESCRRGPTVSHGGAVMGSRFRVGRPGQAPGRQADPATCAEHGLASPPISLRPSPVALWLRGG